MTCAYDPIYLEQARRTFAGMLDFAVSDLQLNLAEFYRLFLATGTAEDFAQGDPCIIAGKSGAELAGLVMQRAFGSYQPAVWTPKQGRSEEYWTGWALAWYQWHTSQPFAQIETYAPIEEIRAMYSPYHEMDIQQFSDAMNLRMREQTQETSLKRLRTYADMTQRALAERSGVPLRTIQQYEQRQKDLRKASGHYHRQFANALNCRMEDLLM